MRKLKPNEMLMVCSNCGLITISSDEKAECHCDAPHYPRIRINKKYISADGKRVILHEWPSSRKRRLYIQGTQPV